jgi:hypothetical protein
MGCDWQACPSYNVGGELKEASDRVANVVEFVLASLASIQIFQ